MKDDGYGLYREDSRKVFDWIRLIAPKVILLSVFLGLLTRIILIILSEDGTSFSFFRWLEIFFIGALNDICFSIISLTPAMIVYIFLNDAKYGRLPGWMIILILAALTAYSFYPGNFFSSYAHWVTKTVRIGLLIILTSFCIRFFIPSLRKPWRAVTLTLIEFCYVQAAVVNVLCESIFWHEYGVRYNFIAVDRLLYSENALKSVLAGFPIVPISIALFLVAVFLTWKMFRKYRVGSSGNVSIANATAMVVLFLILSFLSVRWLDFDYRRLRNSSRTATELKENGCWNWLEACATGNMEYNRFYPVMPTIQAQSVMDGLAVNENDSTRAPVQANIVVLALENFEYRFIEDGLCPFIDSLSRSSIFFTNMYASGSSMSKGMDALTLCVPPSPGRSIVNRFDNEAPLRLFRKKASRDEGLPTTGRLLQSEGYSTAFIYGGNARRANLRRYFSGNGYDVQDISSFGEITFRNSIGACDDDAYAKLLEYADGKASIGSPFHIQIVTLSCHSPYTFPNSKIVPRTPKEDAAGYADSALERFFTEARSHPWFANTVFVLTSPRGSENSGEEGPRLEDFHIPALIYSQNFATPQRVDKVCSLIDMMPTVFSMLGLDTDEHFLGRDILSDNFQERAFVSNYLQMGYLRESILTVLQPMRQAKGFDISGEGQKERSAVDSTLLKESTAIYQTSSNLY